MATPLSGQTALVTGGSKGYGVGIAGALKAAGASVWITGRDPVALEKTAASLGVNSLRADVTSAADWDAAIAEATRASGRLDILVNNAGGGIKIAATEDQTDESIAAAIALNLTAVIYGARRAARIMRQQRSGTIVNIPSVAGLLHSRTAMYTVPPTNSRAVMTNTILKCMLHFRGLNPTRRSSISTGNPKPPVMISAAIVRFTTGSDTKPMRLSE